MNELIPLKVVPGQELDPVANAGGLACDTGHPSIQKYKIHRISGVRDLRSSTNVLGNLCALTYWFRNHSHSQVPICRKRKKYLLQIMRKESLLPLEADKI